MSVFDVRARIAEMSLCPEDSDLQFYSLTLTASDEGEIFLDTQTIWAGFADEDKRVELREARLVSTKVANLWASIGMPFVLARNHDDLTLFFLIGGNCLVERSIAETEIPEFLTPQPSLQIGWSGYVNPTLADPSALKRAPTPKLRMKVLRRDGRRCRICGRTPDDNVDLVLHVHHIRPWENRGITDQSNLITLCHTCHTGLDPHYDPTLYHYLEPTVEASERVSKFFHEVRNYQHAIMLR